MSAMEFDPRMSPHESIAEVPGSYVRSRIRDITWKVSFGIIYLNWNMDTMV